MLFRSKSAKLQQQIENEILQSYQSLYRLAYSYVKNPDDAMDVVQESAYKAILHADEMRFRETVKGWLCRIVVNTALDLIRRRKRESLTEEIPETGREDTYENIDVMRALDTLDEREKTVVMLRFFQDMKLSEISSITGESLSSVKSILYRSLRKLKVKLTEGDT